MASSLQPGSPQPSSGLSNSSSSTPTAQSEWVFPSPGQHSSSAPSTPETDRKSVFMNDELRGVLTPPHSGAKSKRCQRLLKKSLDDVCLDKDGDEGSPKDNAYSMHSPKSSFHKDARSRYYRSTQQDGSHSSKHHLKFERTVATQTPPMSTFFTCRNCRRTRRAGSEYNGSPQRTSNIRREAEQSGAVARRGSWGCASSAWQQVGRELLLIADDISRSSGSLNSNRGGSSDSNESIWRLLIRSGFRLGASVVAATTSHDDTLFRRRCSSMGALGGHQRRRTSH